MGSFKVPRAQRQVGEASQVIQGREQAFTAGLEAEAQLGRSIVQAGAALATVADRNQRARDRIARESALNRSSNAANLVQQDSVQFLADELNKPGSNAEGNVERYDEFVEALIQDKTADFPEELKALTRQRLQGPRLKNRTKLALHQEEQRKGETFSILDKSLDVAVQEAANNPTLTNIQEQIESVATLNSLYKLSGSIDEEEAQARVDDAKQKIMVSAISSATLQDPEAAQTLVDATKAVLPADIVKTLEADIRKQTKLQKDEREAVRTEAAQTFISNTIDLAEDGDATVTQAQASPVWEELTPKEKSDTLSIIRKGSPFNKSVDAIRAALTTEVNANPTLETRQKLLDAHADGLSTVHFKELFKQLEATLGQDETPQQAAISQGYTIFNDAKTNNVFDSNEAKNSVEWARATQAFEVFVAENPEAKPEEITNFAEQMLIEVKRGFLGSAWDLIRHPILFKRELGASEDEPKSRRLAISALTAAGQEITEANIIDAVNQLEDAGEL